MPTTQDAYLAAILAAYPAAPYAAAGGANEGISAFYKCDDASGTIVDYMNWDGDGRCDLSSFPDTGAVNYGLPGPFAGAKAIEFVADGSHNAYANSSSFISIGGSSSNIGDECISVQGWVKFPGSPGSAVQVIKGHGGILGWFSAASPNLFSPGTHMWTSIVTLALSNTSSFAIPVGEWHFVSWQHHQSTGENHHVTDDSPTTVVDEDSGTNTSVPTGGPDHFTLGAFGGGPIGAATATVQWSNVAVTRGCPSPILYPPPVTFRPQIYRRQKGG